VLLANTACHSLGPLNCEEGADHGLALAAHTHLTPGVCHQDIIFYADANATQSTMLLIIRNVPANATAHRQ
jgi:hypothetical protein